RSTAMAPEASLAWKVAKPVSCRISEATMPTTGWSATIRAAAGRPDKTMRPDLDERALVLPVNFRVCQRLPIGRASFPRLFFGSRLGLRLGLGGRLRFGGRLRLGGRFGFLGRFGLFAARVAARFPTKGIDAALGDVERQLPEGVAAVDRLLARGFQLGADGSRDVARLPRVPDGGRCSHQARGDNLCDGRIGRDLRRFLPRALYRLGHLRPARA